MSDRGGLVVIGRGVAGRSELAVELFDATTQAKGARSSPPRLLASSLGRRPEDERCSAQIAAGNAASLRRALALGFVPIGAEVVIAPSS